MARNKKKRKRGKKSGKVVVRYHTRTPRGPNHGKPRVRVRQYTRSKPRKKPKN